VAEAGAGSALASSAAAPGFLTLMWGIGARQTGGGEGQKEAAGGVGVSQMGEAAHAAPTALMVSGSPWKRAPAVGWRREAVNWLTTLP